MKRKFKNLFGSRGIRFKIRQFYERGRYGFAEEDTWSFDSYLAKVISGGVDEIKHRNFGQPDELTPGEWYEILNSISQSFKKYNFNRDDILLNKEGWKLLKKYFSGLWD